MGPLATLYCRYLAAGGLLLAWLVVAGCWWLAECACAFCFFPIIIVIIVL